MNIVANKTPVCWQAIEIWLLIAGWEGKYEVSSYGRVRSVNRIMVDSLGRRRPINGRLLKPRPNKDGHLQVTLSNIQTSMRYVHHLVLETFVGPRPDGSQACHFPDKDPSNNCLSNLRWGTAKDNARDRTIHGSQVGENGSNAKVTERDVRAIRSLYATGVAPKNIALQFNVGYSCVYHICTRNSWRHLP
jgi:hypothetical protein